MIRPVQSSDASAIAHIYNHYVEQTTVTFEEAPVSNNEMGARIAAILTDGLPWLVFEKAGQVVGYAYASKWKPRSAYRFSVESSVYIAANATGGGVGTALYTQLLALLARQGVNAVIGGITLPNPASIALHEKVGMHKVAHFERVGNKFSTWLDVGYWQTCLS